MPAETPATIPIRPRRWLRERFSLPALRLAWQRWQHHLHLRLQWWQLPHEPFQTVFVIASHRSGSNLLLEYLKGLSGVGSHHEVLCRVFPTGPARHQVGPAAIARHLRLCLHGLQTPIRGCKLMLNQLEESRVTLDDLRSEFPDAKYIVLYRRSLAEQFVSMEAALQTNQWTLLPDEERRQTRVRIHPGALRSYCEQLRSWYGEVLALPWLPERSLLLSYEELVADPRRWVCDEICPLIGAPAALPQSPLRKQNLLPLAQRVENYREVAGLLNGPLCRQQYFWPAQRTVRRAA